MTDLALSHKPNSRDRVYKVSTTQLHISMYICNYLGKQVWAKFIFDPVMYVYLALAMFAQGENCLGFHLPGPDKCDFG